MILKLKDEHGNWKFDEDGTGQILAGYFKDIFSSSNPEGGAELVDKVDPYVARDMNLLLTRDFTSKEI